MEERDVREEEAEEEERVGRGKWRGGDQSSTTKIAESRTGRITREVIGRRGFISKTGLVSFCFCLNEIAN